MTVFNISVARGADGSKHLDLQIHGVIDGGWLDEDGVSTSEIIAELNRHLDAKTVGVRINSVGGSAFGGIALYNALKAHPADVKVYVEGLAASAASLVAMAGETVMGTGAMLMIHPPLTVAIGNASELRKTADVLDKIQSGIAAIYVAKTGKSLDEINAMITAETWMGADEAIAAGFADGVGEAPPQVAADPASELEAGDQGQADSAPTMTADAVMWNGVSFPIASLPQQQVVLAMAKPKASTADPSLSIDRERFVQSMQTMQASLQSAPITRAMLEERAPELLAAILSEGMALGTKEGHAAGVAEERARLQAIDELGLRGCDEMVAAAKYGDEPKTAEQLAVAAVKAAKVAGLEILEARKRESKEAAGVRQSSPSENDAAAKRANDERLVRAIVGRSP